MMLCTTTEMNRWFFCSVRPLNRSSCSEGSFRLRLKRFDFPLQTQKLHTRSLKTCQDFKFVSVAIVLSFSSSPPPLRILSSINIPDVRFDPGLGWVWRRSRGGGVWWLSPHLQRCGTGDELWRLGCLHLRRRRVCACMFQGFCVNDACHPAPASAPSGPSGALGAL